ncbi:MAG: clostripain-related cysteine peptidase [bacterium]
MINKIIGSIYNKLWLHPTNPFIDLVSDPIYPLPPSYKPYPIEYFPTSDNYEKQTKVEEEGKKKKWLVIHYGGSDNDLARYIFRDLDELEKVGSDHNTHIVSLLDMGKQFGMPFEGARVFYVKQDNQKDIINSPVIKKFRQVDTSDPKFMATLIKEIIRRFPADNIALIISNHGVGWKGIVTDDSAGSKFMHIDELREALGEVVKSTGKKIDVVAFDACLMAMAEVGYELKDVAKYMVASEEIEGGNGYEYSVLFSKAMKNLQSANLAKINMGPEEFAKLIVHAAKEYSNDIRTISAVDLEKANNLAKAMDSFAKTLIPKFDHYKVATIIEQIKNSNNQQNSTQTQDIQKLKQEIKDLLKLPNLPENLDDLISTLDYNDAKRIKDKIPMVQSFRRGFKDLKHFMKLIQEDNEISEEVRKKASKVMETIDEYVIAEFHNSWFPNANGVSVDLSLLGDPVEQYKQTLIAKDTNWDELIEKIS